ncbi:nucleic-acid-binding protein from transposon X-element [Trichonephila clavipes]|nr:nucleic-acid-binding protein from transposon X-element [Trichonephila clavipes]
MARTKQTGFLDSGARTLVMATDMTKRIKEHILSMDFVQTDQQMCDYLTMKWQLARAAKCGIELLETKLEISKNQPNIMSPEDIQTMTTGLEALRKELSTVMGEITLIFCPVKNCPYHTNGTKNDSTMAESSNENNETNNPKKNNEKVKRPNNNNNVKDNPKSNKRAGEEEFKTPNKFAKKIIEVPIEQIVCTSNNKFAVLDNEELMEVTPTPPKVQPIMMRLSKNYNLILQEINRSHPNTKNKNTGSYIRIQPATVEEQNEIKKFLTIKKADHYLIDHPKITKAVIKGLPTSTNITDIEADLKEKGFEVEKIAQLRKFSTKSPLPLFMIQLKKLNKNAQDIYKIKNINYLTVEFVPFRRRPGASQCFNCNYFNHASKDCRMTPRCLKCGKNHTTATCPITERLKTLHCINCNEDGHMATSRQCSRFPKLKSKKEETRTDKNIVNQSRPVTPEVSYANICSNKTKQQMAPRGETPEMSNKSSNDKTSDKAEPAFQFEKFATYINELQNLTSKWSF